MSKKEELKDEIDNLVGLRNSKMGEIDQKKKDITKLNHLINETYKKLDHVKRYENIQISDHAIIRWMERKHGVNFDRIRDEILTERILKNILAIQSDGTYERRVVKNGVIVTVLDPKN